MIAISNHQTNKKIRCNRIVHRPSLPVFGNTSEKRFEPALGTLAMSVEEGDHLPFDLFGSNETGADKSRSLARSHDSHRNGKFGHVILQFFTQVIWGFSNDSTAIQLFQFDANQWIALGVALIYWTSALKLHWYCSTVTSVFIESQTVPQQANQSKPRRGRSWDCTVETSFTGVVDEDNLGQELAWWARDDGPHRPQQRRPGFVMEHYDDACRRKKFRVVLIAAPDPIQINSNQFKSIHIQLFLRFSLLSKAYVRDRRGSSMILCESRGCLTIRFTSSTSSMFIKEEEELAPPRSSISFDIPPCYLACWIYYLLIRLHFKQQHSFLASWWGQTVDLPIESYVRQWAIHGYGIGS